MLPADDLTFAIEIQHKSYLLLRWVADSINAGRLAPATASRHAEGPEAAVEWVHRFHDAFPSDVASLPLLPRSGVFKPLSRLSTVPISSLSLFVNESMRSS